MKVVSAIILNITLLPVEFKMENSMKRSGQYITQINGYKAFKPTNLPPNPSLQIDEHMEKLLEKANLSLARLDGLAYLLPNPELFISMYVKKEALLSAQIEGTQASLEDLLEFESRDNN